MATSLYQDLNPNEARILILDPASDRASPITCALRTISLGNYATSASELVTSFAPLPFEALSYVWGSSFTPAEITVNGRPKRVGENLDKALRGLRRKPKRIGVRKALRSVFAGHGSKQRASGGGDDWLVRNEDIGGLPDIVQDCSDGRRSLWIDAICINQEDAKEKTVQVRLMSRIYRNATRVLVWLGDGDSDLDRTIRWMKERFECGLISSSHLDDAQDLDIKDTRSLGGTSRRSQKRALETEEATSKGLERLRNNDYWHRMWTAPEFGLAMSDPLLISGDSDFEAGYLWPALEDRGLLQDMSSILQSGNKHIQNSYSSKFSSMQTSLLIRRALKRPGDIPYQIKPSLGLFLTLTWARKCKDNRDKIFALYGLFLPKPRHLPEPDYDKDHTAVVAEAVAYIINEERDLDLLCYLALRESVPSDFTSSPSDQSHIRSPSWLPDLFNGSLADKRCPARFMTRYVSSDGGLKAAHYSEEPEINAARLNKRCTRDVLFPNNHSNYGTKEADGDNEHHNSPIPRIPRPFVTDDLRFLVLHGVFLDRIHRIVPLADSKPPASLARTNLGRIKEFSRLIDQSLESRRNVPTFKDSSLADIITRAELQDKWQTLTPAFEPAKGQADDSAKTSSLPEKKRLLKELFEELLSCDDNLADQALIEKLNSLSLWRYLQHYIFGRHLFITRQGIHGLSTLDIREGDELYTIDEVKLPFVLRRVNRTAKARYFRMIGGANVAGIMMGELNKVDDMKERIQELRIV